MIEPNESRNQTTKQSPDAVIKKDSVKEESARRTRRSFLVAGAAAAGGYGFYRWLEDAPATGRLQNPLRATLSFNEAVARGVFDERGLAPTYPVEKATNLRVNGNYGLKQRLELASWRLQLVGVEGARTHPRYTDDVTSWQYRYAGETARETGPNVKVAPKAAAGAGAAPPAGNGASSKPSRGLEEAGLSQSTLEPGTPGLLLTLDDVTRLPHHGMVTEFKCIEGWSQVVQWGGVRLADLLAAYPPARNRRGELPRYVYMETPNGDYYTGYEISACRHPQSLLVTEMGGQPLLQEHGAPLRLHMPIKYGYKQIKRIGLIAYTDHKPDDYWTKLGYDFYAGL